MGKRKDTPKVYLATFPNGKQYVGITTATLNLRKVEHYSRARKGSKYAIHNALNKYGEDVKWEVLTVCSSYEEAKEMEVKFIAELNTLAPNGYNLTSGGDGTKGYKATGQHIERLSQSHKGYIMPQEQKDKIKKSLTGILHKDARKLVATNIESGEKTFFESITKAQLSGFSRPEISKVCNGKRKSHKGYYWEYLR